MKKILKRIPKFKSKKVEVEFWETHDSTDYIDYSKAKKAIFPNLKPTSKLISIRLPEGLINNLKTQANERGIAYQALIKQYLYEKVLSGKKTGHGG